MPRKGPVPRREVLPDPIYNSKLVTRLINRLMIDGKKGKAQRILYEAFDIIRERTGKDPMEVFEQALEAAGRAGIGAKGDTNTRIGHQLEIALGHGEGGSVLLAVRMCRAAFDARVAGRIGELR